MVGASELRQREKAVSCAHGWTADCGVGDRCADRGPDGEGLAEAADAARRGRGRLCEVRLCGGSGYRATEQCICWFSVRMESAPRGGLPAAPACAVPDTADRLLRFAAQAGRAAYSGSLHLL